MQKAAPGDGPSEASSVPSVLSGELLKGRVALLTGAGGSPTGLGLATARLFRVHGARVFLLDTNFCEEASKEFETMKCDVTCKQTVDECVSRISTETGDRVDVVVHFAGITQPLKFLEISEDDYRKVVDISLKGSLLVSQAAIPLMKARGAGSLVFISSVSAQQGGGIFGGPHYCGAKAGCLGLMRACAKEFGSSGIRANAICPSLVETGIAKGMTEETREKIRGGIPLGRTGKPDDVAGVCLFLASDLSAYVSGATIDVNGASYFR
uniref:Ketoreductase (KR) domain-containing protein n=1 Tax=Chromera velia CCMP2878 TaxID=1169474 RepID=A0A0G4FIK6_9ALVE|eukprot:Cvel_3355.t1-p1 / transcript=Cvel_3355.t1 / gene=Cvel_3355 / organism=Chromera_velia_CCMP2878 / gene_product=Uncharacterized short-chain type, putative / transcript_product=Uncharacterized short-chain type, putative / location=Cvel_scaffold134:13851-18135(+) / protein_length=266 / sequence_SO=supercontig / SO=protein_coding / is_pseudo=false